MLIADFFKITPIASLAVVAAILAFAITLSVVVAKRRLKAGLTLDVKDDANL
jgi:hypothetical protein